MKKQLILKRLWATIEKLVNLEPEQFNYSAFVLKGDVENVCGTVCCVAGWYPKWFPKAGLSWWSNGFYVDIINGSSVPFRTDSTLAEYHGLSLDIIDFLFYGIDFIPYLSSKGKKVQSQIYNYWKNDLPLKPSLKVDTILEDTDTLTIEAVIMKFRFIHYLIENDYIENYT